MIALLLLPQVASACPVCVGDPNAPMQKGLNNGIMVLLAIVAFVQIGFVALFWVLWKRARVSEKRHNQFRFIEGGVR